MELMFHLMNPVCTVSADFPISCKIDMTNCCCNKKITNLGADLPARLDTISIIFLMTWGSDLLQYGSLLCIWYTGIKK